MSRALTALVDLGSNSVRLMLVRIEPDVGYRVLRDERVQTRLGDGSDAALSDASVARTVEAVTRVLGPWPSPLARAIGVATAAVREAPNAEALLGRLSGELGLEVEVLTADEEARLGALAARASLQLRDATVADVGGRSLQISAIRDREPIPIASAALGALRTTREFLAHDPPTPDELDALRAAVRAAVAGHLPLARAGEALVGVGGTARALARLADGRHAGQRVRISLEDLAAMCGRLAVVGLAERRQIAGLKAERADVIVAGAVVFDEILRRGGYRSLLVAAHGVRHGVLLRETFERLGVGRAR